MPRSRLMVVDGNAVVARHYSVVKHLSVPEIASGAERIICSLAERWNSGKVLIAFDSPKSFRKKRFSGYKGKRSKDPKKSNVYSAAMARCQERGWACAQVDGYEADDIVAVAARRFEGDFDSVLIVSGDKDLYQVISDKTSFYLLGKKERLKKKAAEEDFGGVPVARMAEAKAIMGDRSDSLPGVGGVGIKKAKEVIATYESLDQALEALKGGCEKLKPQLRKNLWEGRDDARFTYEMVKLPYMGGAGIAEEIPDDLSVPEFINIGAIDRNSWSANIEFTGIKPQNIVRTVSRGTGDIPGRLAKNEFVAMDQMAPGIRGSSTHLDSLIEDGKMFHASQIQGAKGKYLMENYSPIFERHPYLTQIISTDWNEIAPVHFLHLLVHATESGSFPILSLCGIAIAGNEEVFSNSNIGGVAVRLPYLTRIGELVSVEGGEQVLCSVEHAESVYNARLERLSELFAKAAALAKVGSKMVTAKYTAQLQALA